MSDLTKRLREPDHERLWLEPRHDGPDDRMWCQTDVWSGNQEYADDGPPTEYVRADIAAARIAELEREVEEQMFARGRLRLWLEFIHLNCNSAEVKEFAGEALNGAHVPEGFSDE